MKSSTDIEWHDWSFFHPHRRGHKISEEKCQFYILNTYTPFSAPCTNTAFLFMQKKCDLKHPPGDEIYRSGTLSMFEVQS
jgi:hypothetical protein